MRIAVDLDDVLAKLIPYLMETHERLTGERLAEEDVTGWDVFVRDAHDEARYRGGYSDLAPVDGARDFLTWLRQNEHTVFIVTYRSEEARTVTERWLAQHIGDRFDGLRLVGGSKVEACRQLDVDVIIDDSRRHISTVTEALEIPGILVRTSMNRDWTPPQHVRVAESLADVRGLVHTLVRHGGEWPENSH